MPAQELDPDSRDGLTVDPVCAAADATQLASRPRVARKTVKLAGRLQRRPIADARTRKFASTACLALARRSPRRYPDPLPPRHGLGSKALTVTNLMWSPRQCSMGEQSSLGCHLWTCTCTTSTHGTRRHPCKVLSSSIAYHRLPNGRTESGLPSCAPDRTGLRRRPAAGLDKAASSANASDATAAPSMTLRTWCFAAPH